MYATPETIIIIAILKRMECEVVIFGCEEQS